MTRNYKKSPVFPYRKLAYFAALASIVLVGWHGSPRSQSGAARAAQKDSGEKRPRPLYYGVDSCSSCHTQPPPTIKNDPDSLCRCTEYPIWFDNDKHLQAYAVLKGTRAARMGELLGYKVLEAKQCVSCHGVYIVDPAVKDESIKVGFNIEEGVSCVACHGAYEDWIDTHGGVKKRIWRTYTRDKKEKEFGMADLWDPAKRTKMCASCHIGSAEEGKVVTHDMYAAGHPPLPSFEVATFSEEMPRHWQYIKEKKPNIQKLLKIDPPDAEWERSKLVVISGAVNLRETMSTLAREADQAAGAGDANRQGMDLAHFDCYACHHDLKSPSWRQQRGFPGKPGRPQMQAWPTVLVRLGLKQLGKGKSEFDAQLKKVHDAFDAQPFGDPKAIAVSAKATVQWLNQFIDQLEKSKLDQTAAHRLLRELCALSKEELLDYDSARQVIWAFENIYAELQPKPDGSVDAKIKEQFTALDKLLKLRLPSGPKRKILEELPQSLERINSYEAKSFQDHMEELGKLLPKN